MKKTLFLILIPLLLVSLANPVFLSARENKEKGREAEERENRSNSLKFVKQFEKKAVRGFKNESAQQNFVKQTKKRIEILDHKIQKIEEKINKARKELEELKSQREKLLAILNNAVDRTAPVISSVQASNIATSSASINWLTDENSDSLVKYGTSTLNYIYSKGGTTAATSTMFFHNINLDSLLASTTYYYIVSSKDSSGNTATSSEKIFAALSL